MALKIHNDLVARETASIDKEIATLYERKQRLQVSKTYDANQDPNVQNKLQHQAQLHQKYPEVNFGTFCFSERLKGEAAVDSIIALCQKSPHCFIHIYEDNYEFDTFEEKLLDMGFTVSPIIECWYSTFSGIEERYKIIGF